MKRRSRQAGFTLIELMVAMLVSTLLVGMILAIFARVSLAYRSQEQVASLQQVLASARGLMEADAKQAGFGMAQGYKVAHTPTVMHAPVEITNNSDSPDTIAFAYGDPSAQAAVTAHAWPVSITVDSVVGFAQNDVVLLSTPSLVTQSPIAPGVDANVATFDACVVQITGIAGNVVTFANTSSWNSASNSHCDGSGAFAPLLNTSGTGTMMYKFVAHAYRINLTGTPALTDGQFEMSPTGNLLGTNDFAALGFGFTDLQVAAKFYDGDGTDQDGDGDGNRDFYSGALMTTNTTPIAKTASFIPMTALTISLVTRTDKDVEGIATAATPALTTGTATNNAIGDRASIVLPATPTAACNATCVTALAGNRIYRYATFGVDLRNMGVGR